MRAITIEEMKKEKFGRLKVIRFSNSSIKKEKLVDVVCDCGKEFTAYLGNVRSGHTKSCGCLNVDSIRSRSITHGLSKHVLYTIYNTMKSRCYNKNNKKYSDYGGRGIVVCDEWLGDFQCFFDFSIKSGWKKGLQIDRINNDGNYSSDNCRFIQNICNANNKRVIRKDNKTGFRGVYKKGKYFVASLRFKGVIKKDFHGFSTAIEAAIFRDKKCLEMGIMTTMNFPIDEITT